jgi:cell division septation protein DedD
LALIDDGGPVHQARIIPADQQQAITPSDQQQTTAPFDQQQAIIPSDQQQATISSRSMHDAPPGSSYSLTSTPPDVAIEPLKNSPAASPRENAAVPANDGGYVVQVSAERSDAKAQASFKTLQSKYPHVLGNRSSLIRRVGLGKKGIFYRAQIGPFDTVEQAKQLCARLTSAGGHCMVQKNFLNAKSTVKIGERSTGIFFGFGGHRFRSRSGGIGGPDPRSAEIEGARAFRARR